MAIKKEHIDKFAEIISKKLKKSDSVSDIIVSLCEAGLTDNKRVRNYLIIQDFFCILPLNEYCRKVTYAKLSDEYDLNIRQIEKIVSYHRKTYSYKANVKPQHLS